jgi:hypothetical protein
MVPSLKAQGCLLIKGEKDWNRHVMAIVYPPGATRQDIGNYRALITFPGGFELLELKDRHNRCTDIYFENRMK